MTDDATIREATADDREAVLRLYGQLHRDDPVLDDDTGQRVFEAIIGTPGLTLLVLETEGSVVATTYLNIIPNLTRAASPYAVVENVVVDESLRGRGLGQQLMAATLERAWSARCYKAMLQTSSKDPGTHAFYRSCGFAPDAKTAYLARPAARAFLVEKPRLVQADPALADYLAGLDAMSDDLGPLG